MKRFCATICIVTTLASGFFYKPAAGFGGGIAIPVPLAVLEIGTNLAANAVSAGANSGIFTLMTLDNAKEFIGDGIATALVRSLVQVLVSSIVNWINSGFEGSPAFVADLEAHLRNVADQAFSEILLDSDLSFLCSPFKLDVQIALAQQHNRSRRGLPFNPECSLEEVSDNIEGFLQGNFQNGGWDAWLALTQSESGDPTAAYLNSQLAVSLAITSKQGEETKLLDFGSGFLSFKVCDDTKSRGGNQKDCTITTPGQVISDQLNKSLGAGQDSLIAADEINEIIGALLGQLAQQALTGAAGLLGLGGSARYASTDYGDGNLSYLEALKKEHVALKYQGEAFSVHFKTLKRRRTVNVNVVEAVDDAEQAYERYYIIWDDEKKELDKRVAKAKRDGAPLHIVGYEREYRRCHEYDPPPTLPEKLQSERIIAKNDLEKIADFEKVANELIQDSETTRSVEEQQESSDELRLLLEKSELLNFEYIAKKERGLENVIEPDKQDYEDDLKKYDQGRRNFINGCVAALKESVYGNNESN